MTMTLLTTAFILLQAAEVTPHRIMTEAVYTPGKRTATWSVNLCKGEGAEYIPVPGSKSWDYTLDFTKANISREKRVKSLPRDRSDMAEILIQRVLLPYVTRVRDECSVKDNLPWRSVTIGAVNGIAGFEFDRLKYRPALNYKGIIRCESHEVALLEEETQRLNSVVRSILNLLNELTSWFEDFGVINGSPIAGGSQ